MPKFAQITPKSLRGGGEFFRGDQIWDIIVVNLGGGPLLIGSNGPPPNSSCAQDAAGANFADQCRSLLVCPATCPRWVPGASVAWICIPIVLQYLSLRLCAAIKIWADRNLVKIWDHPSKMTQNDPIWGVGSDFHWITPPFQKHPFPMNLTKPSIFKSGLPVKRQFWKRQIDTKYLFFGKCK